LPPEEARKLDEIADEVAKRMRVHHKELTKTSAKIAAILRMENPDMAALQTATDELQKVGQDFHTLMAQALARIAREFPLESRKLIADRMVQGDFAFPLHGGKMRPMMPPHHGPQDRLHEMQDPHMQDPQGPQEDGLPPFAPPAP
jgi:hypothetical protein